MKSHGEPRFEYFSPPISTVEIPLRSNEETYRQAYILWKRIEQVLADSQERRIAYLLFHCGLSPKEIVQCCPQEFPDVQEVYSLRSTLMQHLVDIV